MPGAAKSIKQRLKSLEQHLQKENPVLVDAVQTYRQLDRVGRSIGLLDEDQGVTAKEVQEAG